MFRTPISDVLNNLIETTETPTYFEWELTKKKVKVAPRMVKAGTPKSKSEVVSKRNQDLIKRFNSNSTIEGAVELLLNKQ